jgi:hypothetical protein
MPLTMPTWIAAIATVVLAVGAIFTVFYARNAFREQSKEVGLLQLQVKDQQDARQREAEERHRAQAAQVYITREVFAGRRAHAGDEPIKGIGAKAASVTAIVHNVSDQPVYDLRVHWMAGDAGVQAGLEDQLGTLGPRDRRPTVRPVPPAVTTEQFSVIAYFRDAAGARWTLTPDGQLAPVPAALDVGAPLIAARHLPSKAPQADAAT